MHLQMGVLFKKLVSIAARLPDEEGLPYFQRAFALPLAPQSLVRCD